ncbi:hypothetical protein ACFW5I_35025 [Streptomyces sp. NPDC058818]|uniref:hypothetical protein n=1 Tax=Streptomyces sp. NPDC058818 TaxID=3346640 RepID=UPI0036B01C2C
MASTAGAAADVLTLSSGQPAPGHPSDGGEETREHAAGPGAAHQRQAHLLLTQKTASDSDYPAVLRSTTQGVPA